MLSRRTLGGAAVLAAAFAAPSGADIARPAVPEPVRAIIDAMGLEKVADLRYSDAAGKTITAERFAQLLKEGQPRAGVR